MEYTVTYSILLVSVYNYFFLGMTVQEMSWFQMKLVWHIQYKMVSQISYPMMGNSSRKTAQGQVQMIQTKIHEAAMKDLTDLKIIFKSSMF